jgi:hypothetical protein
MARRNTYAEQYLERLEWETRARYKAAQQLPLIRLNALKVAWNEKNRDEFARLVAEIDEEAREHWAREFAQYMGGRDEERMITQFEKAIAHHNGDGDDEPTPPTPPAVVRVPSRRNPAVVYTATTESCNCPGFHYRGNCRHVEMAAKKAAA